MATVPDGQRRPASVEFARSFWLALAAWLGCVVLQAALYLRPAPHGGPFLAEWNRYFWLAVYYDLLGVWLLSLPFFACWLLAWQRPLGAKLWRIVPLAQAIVLTVNLALSQIDHEVLRFLGVRLNPSFLIAYAKPAVLTDRLFLDVVGSDRGGAWLSLALLALVPLLYALFAARLLRRPPRRRIALWLALVLAIVPLAAPANGWRMATSQFRLRKVEPVILAFAADVSAGYRDLERPADYDRLVEDWQRAWLARSSDKAWRFPDPAYPYWREPVGSPPPAPAGRWNVIYLQLETLRGLDTGFLRPGLEPSPTPFLDRLAASPDAAVWTRALSLGMPSINGIFASHCSASPPSRRYITSLTHVGFQCLPEVLRRHGYRTEMFQAADTDWDNSTPWFDRWYDRLWRHADVERRDRELFRRAALRIRELGRGQAPFFATVVSIANHTPFTSVEPAFDIAGQATAAERIRNTTRYTDEAVRELVAALEGEPWFSRTLLVIAGDHGFNVGEHGQVAGRHTLYRESTWVPLIVAGPHPMLAKGRHDGPASLLDIPPTVADLLGLREANAWQGHSLLAVEDEGTLTFAFRGWLAAEAPGWSLVADTDDGAPQLFARADWLQRRDMAARLPDRANRMLELAERQRRLHDYLLRNDRIVPRR